MKKQNTIKLLLAATLIIGTAVYAAEETQTASKEQSQIKQQTTCPVMDGKINKAQFADVKGKRIYVCCPGCIAKIKADPDKYIKQLEDAGVTLDKTPKKAEHTHKHGEHTDHQH